MTKREHVTRLTRSARQAADRWLREAAAIDDLDAEAPASGQLYSVPQKGKAQIVMWAAILAIASAMIILNAGLEAFLTIAAISVLFVIAVAYLVDRML